MRLTVIGCGHLGAAHAAGMAEIGHDVLGVDVDPVKVKTLRQGRAWFHEPGLDELIARNIASGRLRFGTDFAEAGEFGDVHFLGVGTPGLPDRPAYDMAQIDAAVGSLAPHLNRASLVVGKSTVSVGTADRVRALVRNLAPAGAAVDVAWNPEFLREGYGVRDTLRPDRIVIGTYTAEAEKTLREVFAPIIDAGSPLVATTPRTAELVKGAANAFLTTKISFINAMADVSEAAGADIVELTRAIGLDPRIGERSMRAGLGYGGGCLPKDTRAFVARAEELGVGASMGLLHAVDAINASRRGHAVDRAAELLGGDVRGKRVTLWGAAFKPHTDDIRDSPALDVAVRLHLAGALVTVYDPMAMPTARALYPALGYAPGAVEAARNAELVILATEWPEFVAVDPREVGAVVAVRSILDGRNALPVTAWEAAGWTVRRLGMR